MTALRRADAMTKLRVLSLFSGIGCIDLGLAWTGGFETVAFCEINPFARRVLAKHWPEVPCYDDVQTLTAERLEADGISVDVICGGFPCQDVSRLGRGAGLDGKYSGLWSEFARLIAGVKPDWVIVENSPTLRSRGLDRVLRSLYEIGYDAEWHCISAQSVGAPHQRDRIWIVAYAQGTRAGLEAGNAQVAGRRPTETWAARLRHEDWRPQDLGSSAGTWWASEPGVGRVAHGGPARMDRLRSLGNAAVPQIPEIIGRAILAAEAAARTQEPAR